MSELTDDDIMNLIDMVEREDFVDILLDVLDEQGEQITDDEMGTAVAAAAADVAPPSPRRDNSSRIRSRWTPTMTAKQLRFSDGE